MRARAFRGLLCAGCVLKHERGLGVESQPIIVQKGGRL